MPRKAKYETSLASRTTVKVTGLSVNDILSMSPERINKMSDADLTAIAKRLVSASNKRLRRLRNSPHGKYAPALVHAPEAFSVKFIAKTKEEKIKLKKNHRNLVMEEVANMRNFLTLKTSSLTGFKKVLSDMHRRYNTPIDPAQASEFWRGYREFASTGDGYALAHEDSDKAVKLYTDEYNKGNVDLEDLGKVAKKMYEEGEIASITNDPTSALFADEDDDYGDAI